VSILLALFATLAGSGLVLSLAVHGAAVFGAPSPLSEYAWGLHVGIFAVWAPAVVAANRLGRHVKPKDLWRAVLRGCPPWMRRLTYAFFAYAVVNFALCLATFFSASPPDSSGHGTPSGAFRLASGHWMAFYAMALAILWSAMRVRKQGGQPTCPNGHPVSPFARYCEECGRELLPAASAGERNNA